MKTFRLAVMSLFLTLALPTLSPAQDNSAQYYQSANTAYSQQNYDQALRYYKAAVQQNPQMWQAYQGLGNCYYAKGDKASALTNYQQSLQINPNNPQLSQFVQTLQPSMASSVPPTTNDSTASNESATSSPSTSMPSGGMNRNLPRQGKIVFEIGDSDWAGNWNDINNIYGATVNSSETPIGIALNIGGAYVVSPNFQLGARVEYMKKTEESLDFGGLETVLWDEAAVGGALEAETVFPMGDGVNFIGSLDGGFYTLVGSTETGSGTIDETIDLAGSGPGGMVSAGVEFLMDSNKTWTLDLGLAYRFLSFSPITESASGASATLKNADGSNASLDFSGAGLFLGARFF